MVLFICTYKPELTLRPRAFGNNRKAGRLTFEMSPWIDKTRGEPYFVSKFVRRISLSTLLCRSRIRQLPSAFKYLLTKCPRLSYTRPKAPDVESVDPGANNPGANTVKSSDDAVDAVGRSESSSSTEKAKIKFREAMLDKIGDTELVDVAMETIRAWENP